MKDKLRFLLNRIRELLWVRPLFVCLVSILAAFLAKMVDGLRLDGVLPDISVQSLETLLSIIASSMLVIATFSVASMISAYSAASSTATPRSFSLVLADDVSQNALSVFIGSFIFSIVALIALQNDYYGNAGRFVLFALTLFVFAFVIVTFVRWVDRIARLGRLEATIDKVEAATVDALRRRRLRPRLGGRAVGKRVGETTPILTDRIGYVQQIDMEALQAEAERQNARIEVTAIPGAFAGPGRALAHVKQHAAGAAVDSAPIERCFRIGKKRTFDDDPRFGLVVLSEISCRALSPGINDPGTAISVIGTLVRVFSEWLAPGEDHDAEAVAHDRVEVPELQLADLYDDAFSALSRDGAGTFEVVMRLLKAYECLIWMTEAEARQLTLKHANLAMQRAEESLDFSPELVKAQELAARLTRIGA